MPVLTSLAARLLDDAVLSSSHDRARLASLYGPHCHRYLSVIPNTHLRTFSPLHFNLLARFRLGVPISDLPPASSSCPLCQTPLPDHVNIHPLCCNTLKRLAITNRHDSVLNTIASHARRAELKVTIEPRPSHESRQAPDIFINFGFSGIFSDVTVIQPDAPFRLPRNDIFSFDPAQALQSAALAKNHKYSQLLSDVNSRAAALAASSTASTSFYAAAATSYGVLSNSFLELIKTIASRSHLLRQQLPSPDTSALPDPRSDLLDDISCAIQQGNAFIISSYISRILSSYHGKVSPITAKLHELFPLSSAASRPSTRPLPPLDPHTPPVVPPPQGTTSFVADTAAQTRPSPSSSLVNPAQPSRNNSASPQTELLDSTDSAISCDLSVVSVCSSSLR